MQDKPDPAPTPSSPGGFDLGEVDPLTEIALRNLDRAMRELATDPDLRDALARAVAYAEYYAQKYRSLGFKEEDVSFTSSELGVDWRLLQKLTELGIIRARKFSRGIRYYLVNYRLAKEILRKLENFKKPQAAVVNIAEPTEGMLPAEVAKSIPEIDVSFFDAIVGYDDLKQVFVDSIKALKKGKQVHILLCGPPASGKSLFLELLARLPGAFFTTGDGLSKAGLVNIFVKYSPRFLIIDEIDKAESPEQLDLLLTVMWSGKLVYTKHRREYQLPALCNVYAAANRIDKLQKKRPELLSRFIVFELPPYTRSQFLEVVPAFLERFEKIPRSIGEVIAEAVWDKLESRDPRDAVKIARLVSAAASSEYEMLEKVEQYVGVFRKYRPKNLSYMLF